jgi:hypothetical protein
MTSLFIDLSQARSHNCRQRAEKTWFTRWEQVRQVRQGRTRQGGDMPFHLKSHNFSSGYKWECWCTCTDTERETRFPRFVNCNTHTHTHTHTHTWFQQALHCVLLHLSPPFYFLCRELRIWACWDRQGWKWIWLRVSKFRSPKVSVTLTSLGRRPDSYPAAWPHLGKR